MYLTENQLKIEKIIICTIAILLAILVIFSNNNLILKSSHILLFSLIKPLVFIGIILCSIVQAIIFAKVNKIGSATLSVTIGTLTVGIYTIIQAAILLKKKKVTYKPNSDNKKALNRVRKASGITAIFMVIFLAVQTISIVQWHQSSNLQTWEDVINYDFSQSLESNNDGNITADPEVEEESDVINQYDNGDLAGQPTLFSDKWWSSMEPRTIIAVITEIYLFEFYLMIAYVASGLYAITIAKNARIKTTMFKVLYTPFTLLYAPIKGLFKNKK